MNNYFPYYNKNNTRQITYIQYTMTYNVYKEKLEKVLISSQLVSRNRRTTTTTSSADVQMMYDYQC